MPTDHGVTNALIPITFEDGTKLYVEAVVDEKSTPQRQLAGGLTTGFDAVVKGIRNLARDVKGAIEEASPDEVQLEFGLDVKAESDGLFAILVNGSASANLKVTLKWSNP